MSAPTLQGEVVGFRSWGVTPDLDLAPRSIGNPWNVGVNEAVCHADHTTIWPAPNQPHAAPGSECDCGLYALHEPSPHSPFGGTPAFLGYEPPIMLPGAILAWGEIEVYHDGFRAQYAQPILLGVSDEWGLMRQEIARLVARRYHMDLVPVDALTRMALHHGSPIPADQRPELPPVVPGDLITGRGFLIPPSFITSTSSAISATNAWLTSQANLGVRPSPPPASPKRRRANRGRGR